MLKFKVITDWNAADWMAGQGEAEHAVAVQVEKDTRPFVPALTLSLANRTQVDGDSVIYPGPYARFLYYGKVMIDPETGSTFARKGVKKVETDQKLHFNTSVNPMAQSHWFEASKAQNLDKWLRVYKNGRTHFGK